MSLSEYCDVIAAIATPAGPGALGIIRLSGEGALEYADRVFRGARRLATSQGNRLHVGLFMDSDTVLDQVVASVYKSPQSFTGDDTVEFSFHGSPYILQRAMEVLVELGVRPARPGEFTQRAFLHGKLDLSQAEAIADLIAAESRTSHAFAMQQLRGGYSQKLSALRSELINFSALIELELDFSEEDVEFANREQLKNLLHSLHQEISQLAGSFALGNALKKGIHTVIAGQPNAGKSTLLNALLNENRAIVSDIPGTTRDTIEEMINIKGIQFRLVDTAGLRQTIDSIEQQGVQKTIEEINKGVLLLYVYDVTTMTPAEVMHEVEGFVRDGLHVILVGNKTDLLASAPEPFYAQQRFVSAQNGLSLDALKEDMYVWASAGTSSADAMVVTNVRHYHALISALQSIELVQQGLLDHTPTDLLASDLHSALDAIGSIVGIISPNEVLDAVFLRFCIGK